MPLRLTVRELRKEARAQSANVTRYEKAVYPKLTDVPVSESSVKIWGDKAWHSQPKKGAGAPATYAPYDFPKNRWTKRQWDVDHMMHVREGLGPAHVTARLALEDAGGGKPTGAKPAWQADDIAD